MLRKYGTLEAALAAGRFPAEADKLRLYRRIATMDASAPLPPLRDQTPTWGKAATLVREWELNRLADRLDELDQLQVMSEEKGSPSASRHPLLVCSRGARFRRPNAGGPSSFMELSVNSARGPSPPITNIKMCSWFLSPGVTFSKRRIAPGGKEMTSSGSRSRCSTLPSSFSQLHRHLPVIGYERLVGVMVVHHGPVTGLCLAVAQIETFGDRDRRGAGGVSADRRGDGVSFALGRLKSDHIEQRTLATRHVAVRKPAVRARGDP